MKTINMLDQQAEYLIAVITAAIEVDVRCLSRIDPAISPVMYRDAKRDLRIGSELLAMLVAAPAFLQAQSAPVRSLAVDDGDATDRVPEELRDLGLRNADIDRARNPRCIHNRKFSEPCEECERAGPIKEPPPAVDGSVAGGAGGGGVDGAVLK
jgi:hypothetical protein